MMSSMYWRSTGLDPNRSTAQLGVGLRNRRQVLEQLLPDLSKVGAGDGLQDVATDTDDAGRLVLVRAR